MQIPKIYLKALNLCWLRIFIANFNLKIDTAHSLLIKIYLHQY